MPQTNRTVAPIASAWRIYLQRGVRALRARRLDDARNELERAEALAPREPAVLRVLARIEGLRGASERAADLLHRALEQSPDSSTTAAALARVLGLSLGRNDEALALLERYGVGDKVSVPLRLARGHLLLESHDLDGAEWAFRSVARRHCSCAARAGLARVLNARGLRLSQLGQRKAAIKAFERAVASDDCWATPYVNLGVVLGLDGKLEAAREAYQQALLRDPYSAVAYFNLASVQHELGEIEAAVAASEQLLQICPDYPQARASLANALVDLGHFDRAIALLLQVLEREHDSLQAWSSLGLAYICAGNVDRGEACLRQALTLDPNHFNAYYNLALLYATQGRKQEAESVLRQAFVVDPDRASRALSGIAPRAAPLRDLDIRH